jgi:undecaprenyl diphosphate synthase
MHDNLNPPKHVAFIMDGNGRWAKQRGLARTAGHLEGVKRVKEIIQGAAQLGIQAVTFFAFSTENWSRPKNEVAVLMRYLDNFLGKEIGSLHKNNMRFIVIGRKDPVPKYLQVKIKKAMEKTQGNTGLQVVFALNYGGREEIVDAAKKFACEALAGKVDPKGLDADSFRRYFYAGKLPILIY